MSIIMAISMASSVATAITMSMSMAISENQGNDVHQKSAIVNQKS